MREHKYRAWNKEKKKMLSHGELFNIDCSNEYPFLALVAGHYEDCIDPLKVEIMQFTGLQDKNGVDIYEGDICSLGEGNITYTVVWHDTGLMGKQNGSTSFIGLEAWKDEIQVIGNIYENPELLEAEQ